MQISIYNGVTDNAGQTIDPVTALASIKNGTYQKQIEKLRGEPKQAARDAIKKKLPGVTWSGTFAPTRKAENLKEYTGLICIDIDKLDADTLAHYTNLLKADPYTCIMFISPSGNGIKLIVQAPVYHSQHLVYFNSLESYYQDNYSITIDKSGKDTSRLCFLSYDANLYQNPDSLIWEPPTGEAQLNIDTPEPPKMSKAETADFTNTVETLNDVWAFTEKKTPCIDGNRNAFLFLFCCNACKKGFNQLETQEYVLNHPQLTTQAPNVIKANVTRAYEKNAQVFGKYAKKVRTTVPNHQTKGTTGNKAHADNTFSKGTATNTNSTHPPKDAAATEETCFWYESFNQATGRTNYTLRPKKLNNFLAAAGYHRYKLKDQDYQFIKYENNVIDGVNPIDMQDFIVDWCNANANEEIIEMLMRGGDKYFAKSRFSFLPYKHVTPRRDTATHAHFYFQNGIVEITKDGVQLQPYNAADSRVIWKKDIIERDFNANATYTNPFEDGEHGKMTYESDCDFAKYIALVAHNKNGEPKSEEIKRKRFMSICSAIGYMIHGFKPKEGLAVIAVDHQISADKTEANGRTGKSIVGECFQYLKKVLKVDGREFDEKNKFKFGELKADHKIIAMQDCKHNLDFGTFFVPLTNDFTYTQLYLGSITIPFRDSPKFWFDTNFTFKGQGDSFEARQFVIEFDNYFNKNYKPKQEFGHYLFDDWDAAQWEKFYCFMFDCVQIYLSEGLVPYPDSNYGKRKMLQEMPADFYDWANAKEESTNDFANYTINAWNAKKKMLENWTKEAKSLNMMSTSSNQFYKWIKNYCKNESLYFETYKMPGGTAGPGEMYWIGTTPPTEKPTKQTLLFPPLNP